MCEELWEMSGNEGFISMETWEDFYKDYINTTLEYEFEYISNVIEDIMNVKKIVKSNNYKTIYIYTAPKWKFTVSNIIVTVKNDFNRIISELKKDKNLKIDKHMISYIKNQLKDRAWERHLPQIDNEISLLNQYKTYIEQRIINELIINSDYDPKQKSIRARPYKPAIFIDI